MVSEPNGLPTSTAMSQTSEFQGLHNEMQGMHLQLSSNVEDTGKRFESFESTHTRFQSQLDEVKEVSKKLDFIMANMGLPTQAPSRPSTPSLVIVSTPLQLTPAIVNSSLQTPQPLLVRHRPCMNTVECQILNP